MIYICGKCLFAFKRISCPESCPDCGSTNLREATEAERDAFAQRQKEQPEHAGKHAAKTEF